jgi:nucleoside-diphosphate-sugar epimerase
MPEKILVTGGGGFLGSAICRQLKNKGYEVVSFSRKSYTQLETLGIKCFRGDILSPNDLEQAMKGCDGVLHTAAMVGTWGPQKPYYEVNVRGTENVIRAAQKQKVRRLVYTSSPSVVFSGKDICGDNESLPYPASYLAHYPYTKMLAEKSVLNAHGEQYLATTALRPHLIWGPGDPHFLPRLREKAASLRKVGDLKNKVDAIYVDNAAEAHILALEELSLESPNGGRVYFVGQEKPVELWAFIDSLLHCLGLPPVRGRVPTSLAYMSGAVLEALYTLRGIQDREPPMTRFLALNLGRSFYFSHTNARRDFKYKPRVSMEEGLRRLKEEIT